MLAWYMDDENAASKKWIASHFKEKAPRNSEIYVRLQFRTQLTIIICKYRVAARKCRLVVNEFYPA
jgi:hypothetical protein